MSRGFVQQCAYQAGAGGVGRHGYDRRRASVDSRLGLEIPQSRLGLLLVPSRRKTSSRPI